ncbi:MAG: hypothetical protein QNJ70_21145 [Xenococcaceae cyanobacterium MO_207.B15]|nr:hypothetical protein [Xenococcaceae cyanobacterium MO_207.B15]
MKLFVARLFRIMFLTAVISVISVDSVRTQPIRGNSGGSIDSKDCGFISRTPNHRMQINQRENYIRLTVTTNGGQPTLLIVEPRTGKRFCALGDRSSGLVPEISGSWEPGNYNVYVGDRTGNRHQFTLNISTSR